MERCKEKETNKIVNSNDLKTDVTCNKIRDI